MTKQPTSPPPPAKRILWVDDESESSYYHRLYIEQMSQGAFQVTEALDVATALRYLHDDHWDLVVLDLVLPMRANTPVRAAPGLQLLEWIRAESPNREVPVITVTGYREAHLQEQINSLGSTFLPKPVDPDRILGHILQALEPAQALASFLADDS